MGFYKDDIVNAVSIKAAKVTLKFMSCADRPALEVSDVLDVDVPFTELTRPPTPLLAARPTRFRRMSKTM